MRIIHDLFAIINTCTDACRCVQGVALAPTPGQSEYVAGFWADVRQALSKYPLTAATRTALLQLACAGNGFPQARSTAAVTSCSRSSRTPSAIARFESCTSTSG